MGVSAMNTDGSSLRQALNRASASLGISIITPYSVADDTSATVEFVAFLPDFGGSQGMVIGASAVGDEEMWRQVAVAKQRGLFYSALSEDYCRFDYDRYTEALNDWGWFGDKSRVPTWYEGLIR